MLLSFVFEFSSSMMFLGFIFLPALFNFFIFSSSLSSFSILISSCSFGLSSFLFLLLDAFVLVIFLVLFFLLDLSVPLSLPLPFLLFALFFLISSFTFLVNSFIDALLFVLCVKFPFFVLSPKFFFTSSS